MENFNLLLKLKNKIKLKDKYLKLTLVKIWVLNYKSDETSEIISEIFLINI